MGGGCHDAISGYVLTGALTVPSRVVPADFINRSKRIRRQRSRDLDETLRDRGLHRAVDSALFVCRVLLGDPSISLSRAHRAPDSLVSMVCVRPARVTDLLEMQRCNLMCLPENYQLKVCACDDDDVLNMVMLERPGRPPALGGSAAALQGRREGRARERISQPEMVCGRRDRSGAGVWTGAGRGSIR